MSGRIAETFARCRRERRAALVGYLTAFDPDAQGSVERIVAACDAGLDVLELGVPFSDPTADGPAIQAAMTRALAAGARLAAVLDIAARVRNRVDVPIVLFSYANPLVRFGPDRLAEQARKVGIDGALVVDLPLENAAELARPLAAAGIDWVPLVALTTTPARLARIVPTATGFIYLASLKGVTGAPLDVEDPNLRDTLARIRQLTDAPIAVGFGVRNGEQAAAVGRIADGVVVGTALIEAGRLGVSALAGTVKELKRGICGG